MVAEEAEERPEAEEFTEPSAWLSWMGFWVLSGAFAIAAAVYAHWRDWEQVAWHVAFGGLVCGTLLYYGISTRGRVRVDRMALLARDRHGQETPLSWAEIQKVHFVSRSLWLRRKDRFVEVHTDVRKLVLGRYWTNVEQLRDAIITRAGLTQRTEYHWGTVYTRPDEEPST